MMAINRPGVRPPNFDYQTMSLDDFAAKNADGEFRKYDGIRDIPVARPTNASGIRPMEYKVLVLPDAVAEKTASGIYIPDSTKEKEEFRRMKGTLVAMSPMAFAFEGEWPADRDDEKPKVGDRVIFARHNAEEIEGVDGVKYWIMRDTSIIGVMED